MVRIITQSNIIENLILSFFFVEPTLNNAISFRRNLIREGIFRHGITELVQKAIEGLTNFPFTHTRRVPLVTMSHPAYKTCPSATFPLGLRHQRNQVNKEIFPYSLTNPAKNCFF